MAKKDDLTGRKKMEEAHMKAWPKDGKKKTGTNKLVDVKITCEDKPVKKKIK